MVDIHDFIREYKHSKAFRVIILAALLAALPVTIFLSQQRQDIRQRAQTLPVTPPTPTTSRKPGDCIGVSPGVVDIADLSTLLRDYASTTALACDFAGGGTIGEIDIYDLSLILSKYEG